MNVRLTLAGLILCLPALQVRADVQVAPPALLNSNGADDIAFGSPEGQLDIYAEMAWDGGDVWICVWLGPDHLNMSRSIDDGQSWSDPARLIETGIQNEPSYFPLHIATDREGAWVLIWIEQRLVDGRFVRDLMFSRSTDNGLTWSEETVMHPDARIGDLPRLYYGNGVWMLAWSFRKESTGHPEAADIFYSRSTDSGQTWSAQMAIDNNAASDVGRNFAPTMATDGSGRWVAVWDSSSTLGGTIGEDPDILFSRSEDDGLTWSEVAPLNLADAQQMDVRDSIPTIAADGQGNWVATWHSFGRSAESAEIAYSYSSDNALTWSPPALLSLDTAEGAHNSNDFVPVVATDRHGNWVTVWVTRESPDSGLTASGAYSTDNGTTWSDIVSVDGGQGGGSIRVAAGSPGEFLAVWDSTYFKPETFGDDGDIFYSRSTDGGVDWFPASNLNTDAPDFDAATEEDRHPTVAVDGMGNWVVVWESTETLGGTIGSEEDLLVSRSFDLGATWSPAVALNTNAAEDGLFHDVNPSLTTSGSGTWLIAWSVATQDILRPDTDIVLARSEDNGVNWGDPAPLNNNASTDRGDDRFPDLATDGQGNWVAIWENDDVTVNSTFAGADFDILVARSNDDGMTWTDAGPIDLVLAQTSEIHGDHTPQIVTDGNGAWIAVWHATEMLGGQIGDDWDVLYSRSTDLGQTWSRAAPLKTNSDVDGPHFDVFPQLATDGAGHWVAVWWSTDPLSALGEDIGVDADILVATSDDGGRTWSDPRALNTNAAIDSGDDGNFGSLGGDRPQVATDGQGHWLAVWGSLETFGGDLGEDRDLLYALSTDNGRTWTDPSPLNTNAADDEGFDGEAQVLAVDGGEMLVVWRSNEDLNRNLGSDSDLLFTRVVIASDNAAGGWMVYD